MMRDSGSVKVYCVFGVGSASSGFFPALRRPPPPPRVLSGSSSFQPSPSLTNALDPCLPPLQLFRQFIPTPTPPIAGILFRIGCFGFAQQLPGFLPQPPLGLPPSSLTHRP